MLSILFYVIPIAFFTYFGGPQAISNIAITKYRKFRSLNKFISKQHKNLFMIICISLLLVVKAIFYNFTQWMNKTVVKNGDKYEVTYYLKGIKYKMSLPVKDISVSSVFLVTGDNDVDLTDEIEPYFGPYDNFHGMYITPANFNQNQITIETIDGVTKTFQRDEQIILKVM